jgi:hypothetical protein
MVRPVTGSRVVFRGLYSAQKQRERVYQRARQRVNQSGSSTGSPVTEQGLLRGQAGLPRHKPPFIPGRVWPLQATPVFRDITEAIIAVDQDQVGLPTKISGVIRAGAVSIPAL